MMKSLIRYIKLFFIGKDRECGQCGSFNTCSGNTYIRGYNHLCSQAAGDSGHYCYECGEITFDRPFEKYIETLPSWVEPHGK